MQKRYPVWGVVGTVLLAAHMSVHAQDVRNEAHGSPWSVQITPYVWGTGLNGAVRPLRQTPTAHVKQSFSDVLKELDMAFFMNGVIRKGDWVLHLDTTYASLSRSASVDLPQGLTLKGQAKMQQRSFSALAGYRWVQSSQSAWDLMAGVRHWDLRTSVRIAPWVSETVSRSFSDPILAARWRYQWNEDWSTLAYVDVGGFGAGSQHTWQTFLTLNYALNTQWYASVGYRYLKVDYDKRGTRLDFSQQGPVLGMTYRF